ncbi:MAG: hypothetical protein JW720_00995 [Sedimentisphaerales bacterium]|nr:hypothetical protein [Sedimentisphaerales bacterium]
MPTAKNRLAGFTAVVWVVAVIFLSLAILAGSMSKPVGRDEQMYCTAGVLMSHGEMIYRDFSYAAQLPYHPLLYSAVYRMTGTSCYLLAGRMVSVVCDILVVLCILGIYRRIFGEFRISGMLLGLAGAVLYVFNPLVDYANGYAWNHDVVILCVAASFRLYLSIDFKGRLPWQRIGAIGVLLTFASCMRITTGLAALVFVAMLLSQPAVSIRERYKRAAPLVCAAGLVLIWPVWVIVQAPRAFYLNIVKIPMLYGEWLAKLGMVFNKFELTFACLTRPGYLALIGIAIYLGVSMLLLRKRLVISRGRNLLLAALLAMVFFMIAWIPPTMWRQYLAMPVPFLVIGLAYPLFYLRKLGEGTSVGRHYTAACAVTAIGVFTALLANPVVFKRVPLATAPELWTPIAEHEVSQKLSEKVKEPKKVLTLAPLRALEGGCEIYRELSAGAIIYRIGDWLTAEERAVTHTVGADGLKRMLEASPASAVLLGMETRHMAFLEKPLRETVPVDWRMDTLSDGTVLYSRP